MPWNFLVMTLVRAGIALLVGTAATWVVSEFMDSIHREIVAGRTETARAEVAALVDERKQQLLAAWRQERHRMTPQRQEAWRAVLREAGLLE